MSKRYGIVEYFGLGDGHRCGYCKGETSSVSHGMWSHALMCQDYEDLMNRGWRRSGKYVYKPLMNVTCCPQYTIRCEVADLKLTKSQKKVLKRMNNFLIFGNGRRNSVVDEKLPRTPEDSARSSHNLKSKIKDKSISGIVKVKISEAVEVSSGCLSNQKGGPNAERQKCRKAKEIRKERKKHKMEAKAALEGKAVGDVQEDISRQPSNVEKSLEDYIEMSLPTCKTKHKLEVKTVRSFPRSEAFERSYDEEFRVYQSYQVAVHKETKESNSVDQFKRFLVDSPLEPVLAESQSNTIPPTGLGSFHQQYYLDGKLIAVGVLDILPHCVSSKYFFYDPEYDFLSLGTYSALREIYFVRSLRSSYPAMKYYYIGFYIHSCPKMVYKRQYQPSYLLCPEIYQFVPIEKCLPKLDKSKYSRLADESIEPPAPGRPENALVLSQRQAMPFSLYEVMLQSASEKKKQRAEVTEYVTLAGAEVASRILLYRKAPFDSDSDD